MIEISHEMPLTLMKDFSYSKYNDYDYALVHLFEENEEYYQYFVSALRKRRKVILDNSAFELREAFDQREFIESIKKLSADSDYKGELIYVIPDVLHDAQATVEATKSFSSHIPLLPGYPMSVVQGKTLTELTECFRALKEYVSYLGVPFHSEGYHDLAGGDHSSILERWSHGRQLFLEILYHMKELKGTKLHLLGVSLPDEFKYYTTNHPELRDFIASIDSSNPVIHGLKEIAYSGERGLTDKESIKIADLMNLRGEEISHQQREIILWNLKKFREINCLNVI